MFNTSKKILFILAMGILLSGCSTLRVDYEFATTQGFADIQGAFSELAATSYHGYMYYFSANPTSSGHPWDTATLHSPADINGGNDIQQCYLSVEGWGRSLDFYCGGSATTPAKPPEGSYQVNVGSKTYSVNNVTSRIIETNLNNIYAPVIKLTVDSSGKVSLIEWQWWKKITANWVAATNMDLNNNMQAANFSIGQFNWAGDRVGGDIALTSTGQVVPPSQNFTPGSLRVSFRDKAGYGYGFEWR